MLIRTMFSFTVFFTLVLVRLLCAGFHRFLGDYVELVALLDFCWMCDSVEIRSHSNLISDTMAFRLILLRSVIALCVLVLIVPLLVIFGKDFWGQRLLTWTLEYPVWCVSPLLFMGVGGANSLELRQIHPTMAPSRVHDVHILCHCLSETSNWQLRVCRSRWHFSFLYSCCVSPLVGVKAFEGFLQPPFLVISWPFVSNLWYVMVSGCKDHPLWPKASPLHMILASTLVLATSAALILVAVSYVSAPSGWDCFTISVLGFSFWLASWVWGFVVQLVEATTWFLPPFWNHRSCGILCMSTVATVFWIVHYVSEFFVLGSCAMCLLVMLFRLDCLVWGLAVPLVCALCSSPGSDYGFLFPLVCCWMDVCSFGLWLLLWLSVTSSFELWQPKPKAFLPM